MKVREILQKEKRDTNIWAPGAWSLMNPRIVSSHSSAVETVASFWENDPGKCFPILRKTITLKKKKERERDKSLGNAERQTW